MKFSYFQVLNSFELFARMKASAQSSKGNLLNSKAKKSSKDREKRKSQGGGTAEINHNAAEKGSPTKESNARVYAGIDADLLINYVEQTTVEHLSEEITNILTEDINYRLRYIINDALIKARLAGRNAISSSELEQTFQNLRLNKVYGTPSHPTWVPFGDQNLCCLEDKLINLVGIAELEDVHYQYAEPVITIKWIPEQKEICKTLRNYFTTMCQMIVSNDNQIRKIALINISENSRIGPITEWFYNFGYILLSKDITYDCLTLRALDLITVLESSPMCRINASERQLKLLVRLILQRLLKSSTTNEVLKPVCNTLALLCIRGPLKEFVIMKIIQKIDEAFQNYAMSVITVANSIGIDAIRSIVLPNLDLFLNRLEMQEPAFTYSILELYNILCKESLVDSTVYDIFAECFGCSITAFSKPFSTKTKCALKRDMDFAFVKRDLLRTRRKISPKEKLKRPVTVDEVFDMPPQNSKVRKKIEDQKWIGSLNSESSVIVGKTSLLLPVFKQKRKIYSICRDHTLMVYNL